MWRRAGVVLCSLALGLPAAESPDPREFFETRVRPLLAANCFACHTTAKMGGLEMISRQAFVPETATPGRPTTSHRNQEELRLKPN